MTTQATPVDQCVDFDQDGRLCNWTPQPAPTSETVYVTSLPNTGGGSAHGGDIGVMIALLVVLVCALAGALVAKATR